MRRGRRTATGHSDTDLAGRQDDMSRLHALREWTLPRHEWAGQEMPWRNASTRTKLLPPRLNATRRNATSRLIGKLPKAQSRDQSLSDSAGAARLRSDHLDEPRSRSALRELGRLRKAHARKNRPCHPPPPSTPPTPQKNTTAIVSMNHIPNGDRTKQPRSVGS